MLFIFYMFTPVVLNILYMYELKYWTYLIFIIYDKNVHFELSVVLHRHSNLYVYEILLVI